METVVREVRELLLRVKVDPFEICAILVALVDHEMKTYFNNLEKEQYQSYVMGTLFSLVTNHNPTPTTHPNSFLR